MAVAYQSSQTASGTTTASLTVTKPTSTVSGDFLIGMWVADGAGKTVTPPADWTTLYEASANNITNGLYYKVAGGSEPADYTWSVSSSSSRITGAISRFTGQGTLPQVLVSNEGSSIADTGATVSLANTVTPFSNTSNAYMLFFIQDQPSTPKTVSGYAIVTDNPTWTEAYETLNGEQGISMAYSTGRTALTATGNSSADFGNQGTSKSIFGYQVFLAEDKNVAVSGTTGTIALVGNTGAVTGDANVTGTTGTLALSGNVGTVATTDKKWTAQNKSGSPSWTPQDKS